MSFEIAPVRSEEDIAAARDLFRAYAATLPFDLGYQDFDDELADLPGKYAPPEGELFLARLGQKAVGCGGLRPFDGASEIKRLYVAPEGRGRGIGRALLGAILAAADRIGPGEVLLDTLPHMTEALRLYRSAGFVEIAPYYETPIAGTVFLARRRGG